MTMAGQIPIEKHYRFLNVFLMMLLSGLVGSISYADLYGSIKIKEYVSLLIGLYKSN